MPDTLCSIYEQCRHLHNPRLHFLCGIEAGIVFRDLSELRIAAREECVKTVLVLSGCLFEAILFCLIRSQQELIREKRGEFVFKFNMTLDAMVNIFNRWLKISERIPDQVVANRNFVHLAVELEEMEARPIMERVVFMLRQMNLLLEDLAQRFAN